MRCYTAPCPDTTLYPYPIYLYLMVRHKSKTASLVFFSHRCMLDRLYEVKGWVVNLRIGSKLAGVHPHLKGHNVKVFRVVHHLRSDRLHCWGCLLAGQPCSIVLLKDSDGTKSASVALEWRHSSTTNTYETETLTTGSEKYVVVNINTWTQSTGQSAFSIFSILAPVATFFKRSKDSCVVHLLAQLFKDTQGLYGGALSEVVRVGKHHQCTAHRFYCCLYHEFSTYQGSKT